MTMEHFNNFLENKRIALGLNYVELADKCGLGVTTLRRLCLNPECSPTYGTLKKLSDGLGINVEVLYHNISGDTRLLEADNTAETDMTTSLFDLITMIVNIPRYSTEITIIIVVSIIMFGAGMTFYSQVFN